MTQQLRSSAQLSALRQRIRASAAAVEPRVARRTAVLFGQLAQLAFDSGSSVYGGATFGGRSFVRTGRMRAVALAYSAAGQFVRASVSAVSYARYYIRFGILPRRGAIPPAWDEQARVIARDELGRELGGQL